MTIEETLSALLPSAAETALLGACLHTGQHAADAWAEWWSGRAREDDAVCADLAATRSLLPLLARSAARNHLDLSAGVLAYTRAAMLREQLRAQRFRRSASAVLAALDGAGARAFVSRGAALAATVYGDWALRHCHDLDLLVPETDLATAVAALSAAGCVPIGGTASSGRPRRAGDALCRHASGLQIALHTRPFAVSFYEADPLWFAGTAQAIAIEGVPLRIPVPEATLVHVLGHATYSSSSRNLRWVTDVWHVLAHHPAIDWGAVEARLDACRLMLPVAVLLRYLARFGMPIPSDFVRHIGRRASSATVRAEDVALAGALAARRGQLHALWRASRSWRSRARLAQWLLAPAPGYIRSAFPGASPWLVPFCYLYRPFRFLAGRVAQHSAQAPASG